MVEDRAIPGRTDDIPSAGDYTTFGDLGVPVVMVRGADRAIRAFSHLPAPGGAGRARCVRQRSDTALPYHSWSYDVTSGALTHVPDERDFVELCRSELGLVGLRCEVGTADLRQPGSRRDAVA